MFFLRAKGSWSSIIIRNLSGRSRRANKNSTTRIPSMCARVKSCYIGDKVIPPLIGILLMGIQTPTIGLMTIPYYIEIVGVYTLAHVWNIFRSVFLLSKSTIHVSVKMPVSWMLWGNTRTITLLVWGSPETFINHCYRGGGGVDPVRCVSNWVGFTSEDECFFVT